MRKIIFVAALLVAVSACAAPGPSGNVNPSANADAAPTATPAAVAAMTEADALAREKQTYDALKSKNYDAFAAMLADDETYVSSSGVHDKAATLAGVKGFEITDATMTDVKLLNVNKDLYVLTYKASYKGMSGGRPIPPDLVERTSTAWVNRGGKWLAAYHQESKVKEAPAVAAGPSATPKTAPSPTAAPSAAPTTAAAMTATDMDKQVWAALERGDYAAFANYLAEDQLEVEHSGVYTKAQSIKSAEQLDLKGATLSDFKETKLDGNATLVTYMVKSTAKGFNPAGERHATIWVNRGGKWLAVFHQGTEAEK